MLGTCSSLFLSSLTSMECMWARKSHGAIRGWLVWQHILHNILCFDPNVHGCVGEFATLKHSEYFTTCVLCTVHDVTCARRLYGETTIELAPKPRFSSCGYKQWHGAHINLKCNVLRVFVCRSHNHNTIHIRNWDYYFLSSAVGTENSTRSGEWSSWLWSLLNLTIRC